MRKVFAQNPLRFLYVRRLIAIAGLMLFTYLHAGAQQYPVQVTPQLLPPYSLLLSDYYSGSATTPKLNLLLLLKDFNQPQVQVRLRMAIDGQSVSLHSKEAAVYTPITLQSGVPYYVTPSELAQYFNVNNLDISGMTLAQYEQSGKLPEGYYNFCFEVVDVATGKTISNKGCGMSWMTLSNPPILNLPANGESIAPATPQNIIFQWTPQHSASVLAAFSVDYVFTLAEIDDDNIDPQAGFFSSNHVFQDSSDATTYLYDNTKTALIENKRYAWRVQAKAKSGLIDAAMFRNDGYSEIHYFTYKNNCPVPLGVAASMQGQRANISWQNNPLYLDFRVEYREKNLANAQWFSLTNTVPNVSIGDIKPATLYEYRVGGSCQSGLYTFTNLLTFTTNDSNVTAIPNCGTDITTTNEGTPLNVALIAGDTIYAGDFKVIPTQISGSGSYTGEGYVKVSYLLDSKVGVKFSGITLDQNRRLTGTSFIETMYDPTQSNVADVDEFVSDIKDVTSVVNQLLGLTIDNDYGYFQRLKDAVSNILDSELTDQMKTQYTNIIDSMDAYKQHWDSLKTVYDSLPDGPDKDAVGQSMSETENNFTAKQEELKELETTRQQLVTSITDLFIRAVKQLKDSTGSNLANAPQLYTAKKQTIIDEIYDGQSLSLSDTTGYNNGDLIHRGSYYDSIPSSEVPVELSQFATNLNDFTQKTINYKILIYVKALNNYYVNQQNKDKLKDDNILEGVTMIKEIISKKENGETDDSIVNYIKQYITEKILAL